MYCKVMSSSSSAAIVTVALSANNTVSGSGTEGESE